MAFRYFSEYPLIKWILLYYEFSKTSQYYVDHINRGTIMSNFDNSFHTITAYFTNFLYTDINSKAHLTSKPLPTWFRTTQRLDIRKEQSIHRISKVRLHTHVTVPFSFQNNIEKIQTRSIIRTKTSLVDSVKKDPF